MPTLEFKGKPFVYSHHLSVPFRELIPVPEKSMSFTAGSGKREAGSGKPLLMII